jgi:hypothetical protein
VVKVVIFLPAVKVSDSYYISVPLEIRMEEDGTDLEGLLARDVDIEQMDFTVFCDHLACIISIDTLF